MSWPRARRRSLTPEQNAVPSALRLGRELSPDRVLTSTGKWMGRRTCAAVP